MSRRRGDDGRDPIIDEDAAYQAQLEEEELATVGRRRPRRKSTGVNRPPAFGDKEALLAHKKDDPDVLLHEEADIEDALHELGEEAGFGILFLKRLWILCKLLMSTLPGRLCVLGSIINAIAYTTLSQVMSTYIGHVPATVVYGTMDEWNSLALKLGIIFGVVNIQSSLVAYLNAYTEYVWRGIVTRLLHRQYLRSYYQVLVLDKRIDNPDQRLCDDVLALCTNLRTFLNPGTSYIGPIFVSAYYLTQTSLTNWAVIAVLVLYVFIAYVGCTLLLRIIAPLVFQQDRYIGDFRYGHARVRAHAESIAFYRAEKLEQESITTSFDHLLRTQTKVVDRQLPLNIWNMLYTQGSNILMTIVALLLGVQVLYHIFPGNNGAGLTTEQLAQELPVSALYIMNFISALLQLLMLMTAQGPLTIASVNRVMQFFELMTEMQVKFASSMEMPVTEDIVFEDVRIRTPGTNRIILDNLSFVVKPQTSLLITGPSGSGRSSIVRTLAKLWAFDRGRITRPTDIFFVPQRPHMVIGNLRQQVTYPMPEHEARGVSDDHLRALLTEVGLGDLPERIGGWNDDTVDWEDILSLGEQQRVGLARLFFHRPKYAVLDESTSSLNVEWQHRIYARLHDMKMTYISVGQKEKLTTYHDQVVELRGVNGEYEQRDNVAGPFIDLSSEDAIPEIIIPQVTAQEVVQMELVDSKAKLASVHREADKAASPYGMVMMRRVKRLLKLMVVTSKEKLMILLLVINLTAQVFVTYYSKWALPNVMSAIVSREDSGDFASAISIALAYVGCYVILAALWLYTKGLLGVYWKKIITELIHEYYFEDNTFYNITMQGETIDNPEQRIVEDVKDLTDPTPVLYGTVLPTVDMHVIYYLFDGLLGFIATLISIFVTYELTYISQVFLVTTVPWALQTIGQLIVNKYLARAQYALSYGEGDFRTAHTHLRKNAENVALYGGYVERKLIRNRFDDLMEFQWNRRVVLSPLPQVLSMMSFATYLNVVAPGVVFRWLKTNHPDDNTKFFAEIYLVQALVLIVWKLFGQLSVLLRFGRIAGVVNRVGELIEKLEATARSKAERTRWPYSDSDSVAVEGVCLKTPTGRTLISDLSFEVPYQQSMIIMGPSGAGKSSILRLVAGLWGFERGFIERPSAIGRGGLFFLPQHPYMITGTLRQQVLYPTAVSDAADVTDDHLLHLLQDVGLEGLPQRVGGWDCELDTDWENILSLGEQQRIAMVRLFYHKPLVAVLDECTSSLGEDWERWFYNRCKELGMTFVSIGHKEDLTQYHDWLLKLDGRGSYRVLPLSARAQKTSSDDDDDDDGNQ
eukprot:TRINITY_DN1740_c0_g1_i3.p1 TRINITY_DN1740_c0_g1~~TRINITY_DN1740_c0_g1_i3.p1  ORF type:complete len:1312 (-),score=323.71 TRINITY_DN1740_c0_g1_i3:3-3938(-)